MSHIFLTYLIKLLVKMFIQVWQIKKAIWFERDAFEKVLAVNSDKATVIIIIIAWTFFRWALIGRFTYALWRRGIFVCVQGCHWSFCSNFNRFSVGEFRIVR